MSIPSAFQAATLLPTWFAASILICMLRLRYSLSSASRRNLKCFEYLPQQMRLCFIPIKNYSKIHSTLKMNSIMHIMQKFANS